MAGKFTFSFDSAAVKARIQRLNDVAIPIVAKEALKDANALARRQSGALVESSITHSDLNHGRLIWQTKYARRMYFTGKPRLNKNRRATLMWAHKAARANIGKYTRIVNEVVKGGGGP